MLKETGRLTAQMGEPVHRTTIAQTPTNLGFMEEWSEESHYFKKKTKKNHMIFQLEFAKRQHVWSQIQGNPRRKPAPVCKRQDKGPKHTAKVLLEWLKTKNLNVYI